MNNEEITYQIRCRYYGDAKSRRTVFKLGPEVRHLIKAGERVRVCERGTRLYFKKVDEPDSTVGYMVGAKFDIQVGGPIGQELRKFEGEYDLTFDNVRGQYYIDKQMARPLTSLGLPNHGRSINMPPVKAPAQKGGQKDVSEESPNKVEITTAKETITDQVVDVMSNKLDEAALWCLKHDCIEEAKVLAKASDIYKHYIKLTKGDK